MAAMLIALPAGAQKPNTLTGKEKKADGFYSLMARISQDGDR